MTVNGVKEIVCEIIKEYFSDTEVMWGRIGAVKAQEPLAVLTSGAVNRSLFPSVQVIDGEVIHHFPSDMMLEINYFPESSGRGNTAVNDLEEFLNYLNSPYIIQKCGMLDIAIEQEGAVMDLTDLEYDTSWHYRARVELKVSFMQTAKGYKGGEKHGHNTTGYFAKVKIDTE